MGCHILLQGIVPTHGSNPGLPHCRQMLYRLSLQSILKEISPEISLEEMMLKLKLLYFGHLMRTVDSLEKTLSGWSQNSFPGPASVCMICLHTSLVSSAVKKLALFQLRGIFTLPKLAVFSLAFRLCTVWAFLLGTISLFPALSTLSPTMLANFKSSF